MYAGTPRSALFRAEPSASASEDAHCPRSNAIDAEFGQKNCISSQRKSGISSKIRNFYVHSGIFMGILDFQRRTPGIPDVHTSKSGIGSWIPEFRTFPGLSASMKLGILLGFRGGTATLCLCVDVPHLARSCEPEVRTWWCGTGVRGRV